MLGVVVDVTRAREAEGRLASMLASISDGFLLLDHDYRFAFVNRQAEVILNSTAADLLGHSIWEALPDAVGTAFDEAHHRVMENKVRERFEAFYPAPLDIWVEVRAEPSAEGIAGHCDVHGSGQFQARQRLLGHATGDALLVEVGDRLSRQLGGGDVLARQRGDEFVVLLRDASRAEAQAVADRMRSAVLEPVHVGGHDLTTTVSIGLATSSAAATVETLLRDADVALYRAKDAGHHSISWFDVESHRSCWTASPWSPTWGTPWRAARWSSTTSHLRGRRRPPVRCRGARAVDASPAGTDLA